MTSDKSTKYRITHYPNTNALSYNESKRFPFTIASHEGLDFDYDHPLSTTIKIHQPKSAEILDCFHAVTFTASAV